MDRAVGQTNKRRLTRRPAKPAIPHSLREPATFAFPPESKTKEKEKGENCRSSEEDHTGHDAGAAVAEDMDTEEKTR